MMNIPTGREFKDAFSETFSGLKSRQVLLFCILCAVVASVAGPFGTYSALSSANRIAFWMTVVILSVPLGYSAYAISLAFFREKPLIVRNSASVLLGSVLITGLVWVEARIFSQGSGHAIPSVWELGAYVFLIAVVGGAARHVIDQFAARHTARILQAEPHAAAEALPVSDDCLPRLVHRLSADWEGHVCNLSVEDHLVTVWNNHRQEKLRMRFRDAIAEMDGVKGIRVHRSHWVAEHAISGIEREKGRVFVALTNGERVPVSRTYLPVLEQVRPE